MECIGMPLCPDALAASGREIDQKIREESEFLRSQPIYETQRRLFGAKTSITKREQLSRVLYGEMRLPGATRSKKTGKIILDDDVLDTMDSIPYVKVFRRLSKLLKIKSTYIDGLKDEIVNGRIHAFLELSKVKSYRGSSNGPNLQNAGTPRQVPETVR
jgi:DNA polymerase I-like protein with 3'-5' exonuclease and polymerase domains